MYDKGLLAFSRPVYGLMRVTQKYECLTREVSKKRRVVWVLNDEMKEAGNRTQRRGTYALLSKVCREDLTRWRLLL